MVYSCEMLRGVLRGAVVCVGRVVWWSVLHELMLKRKW
jgi:hypothetical protein